MFTPPTAWPHDEHTLAFDRIAQIVTKAVGKSPKGQYPWLRKPSGTVQSAMATAKRRGCLNLVPTGKPQFGHGFERCMVLL